MRRGQQYRPGGKGAAAAAAAKANRLVTFGILAGGVFLLMYQHNRMYSSNRSSSNLNAAQQNLAAVLVDTTSTKSRSTSCTPEEAVRVATWFNDNGESPF